jgi:hypothetical protein
LADLTDHPKPAALSMKYLGNLSAAAPGAADKALDRAANVIRHGDREYSEGPYRRCIGRLAHCASFQAKTA